MVGGLGAASESGTPSGFVTVGWLGNYRPIKSGVGRRDYGYSVGWRPWSVTGWADCSGMTGLRSVGTRRRGNAIDYPGMPGLWVVSYPLLSMVSDCPGMPGLRAGSLHRAGCERSLPWYAGVTGQGCSGSCYIMWESRRGTKAVRGFGVRSFADGCMFWSFAW